MNATPGNKRRIRPKTFTKFWAPRPRHSSSTSQIPQDRYEIHWAQEHNGTHISLRGERLKQEWETSLKRSFASFFCFIHRSILGVAGLHRWRDLQWDQLSWPWSLETDIANQICTKIGLNKPWQRSDTAEHLSKVGCKRLQKNLFKRWCLREKGWTIMKDFRSWINQAARPSKG